MKQTLSEILGRDHQPDFLTQFGVLDLVGNNTGSALHGWAKMYLKKAQLIGNQVSLRKKYEIAKQRQSSENGGPNHRAGSINIAEHAQ